MGAANREELYNKLCMVLDLPQLGPAISLDYLKTLLEVNCPYLKITREQTRTLPIMNFKRRYDTKKTLQVLENLLLKKKMNPTGFDRWAPPDIA